jgi:hypothetical protein
MDVPLELGVAVKEVLLSFYEKKTTTDLYKKPTVGKGKDPIGKDNWG